ncbi:neuropeptide SIFamide [Parasteatoda tepidariorum]|uniref:Metalloendopeptidase n=1 Tax=Parasteatoda tepidariorum TaxID=114398 RepID=A0A2L2YPQ1_PARTP
MSQYTSTVLVIMIFIMYACNPIEAGGRKPPFNGSIFGKRFVRDMDVDSRGSDFRHPACDYVYDACNQWYTSGQDST